MTTPVLYIATARFDPAKGDEWTKLVAWSRLTQLREVISLDGLLCPTVFPELSAEDWLHNVQEDFRTHFFVDLDYLLGRLAGRDLGNVLAVMHEPSTTDLASFADARFVFRGFDLIETRGSISALVNCGDLDKAFANAERPLGHMGDDAAEHLGGGACRACVSSGLHR